MKHGGLTRVIVGHFVLFARRPACLHRGATSPKCRSCRQRRSRGARPRHDRGRSTRPTKVGIVFQFNTFRHSERHEGLLGPRHSIPERLSAPTHPSAANRLSTESRTIRLPTGYTRPDARKRSPKSQCLVVFPTSPSTYTMLSAIAGQHSSARSKSDETQPAQPTCKRARSERVADLVGG